MFSSWEKKLPDTMELIRSVKIYTRSLEKIELLILLSLKQASQVLVLVQLSMDADLSSSL